MAPAGPFFGGGGDEDFHVGLRRDHGSGVAAVEHGAAGPVGKILLHPEKCCAHPGHRGDARGCIAETARAQGSVIEHFEIEFLGKLLADLFIIERVAAFEHREGNAAIKQPSIEMRQAVMRS
jgi:hypothetical protein